MVQNECAAASDRCTQIQQHSQQTFHAVPAMQEIERLYEGRQPGEPPVRVLVPGAGLGRLCLELASRVSVHSTMPGSTACSAAHCCAAITAAAGTMRCAWRVVAPVL